MLALLIPSLYKRHRGFGIVALGIALAHFIVALDELLPYCTWRHNAPVWAIHNAILPCFFWGILHTVMGIFIVVGVYQKSDIIPMVRLGIGASLSLFAAMAGSFFVAYLENPNHVSLTGIGLALCAVCCSLAAFLEPPSNPRTDVTLDRREEAVLAFLERFPIFSLDAFCAEVARDLEVPMAEMNVISRQTQFHVGQYPASGNRWSLAEKSGCRHVTASGSLVSIPNCSADARFAGIPEVRGGLVGSYLALPVHFRGYAVGTVCVTSPETRDWSNADVAALASAIAEVGLGQ